MLCHIKNHNYCYFKVGSEMMEDSPIQTLQRLLGTLVDKSCSESFCDVLVLKVGGSLLVSKTNALQRALPRV